MTQQLALIETSPVQPMPTGLALVIQRLAENPQVDVDKLERIIAMQERILAHEAKSAFDAAFAALQGELPTIVERGRTDKTKYATLEDIVETVRPVLSRHSFSLSHRTEWPDGGKVRVVGILAHAKGHEKQSEFVSLADKSGSKNDIQALGSALSYGRRYTTLDLLGIVTRGQDDDGRATSQKQPTPDEPAGFEQWASDMAAVAREGWAALEAAYKASKPEFTGYVEKYRVAMKNGWKDAARKAARRG